MKKYFLYSLILLIILTGCRQKRAIEKARLQAQCPEIYVLNHADDLALKAPGFERTDSYLYHVSFAQLSDVCIVKKKKTRIHFNLVLEFEGDAESAIPYPPFGVFVSFLDKDKKLLWRERVTYRPSDWKKLNNLRIKNKLTVYYPTDITPPNYVYFGFVQDKETLQARYQ